MDRPRTRAIGSASWGKDLVSDARRTDRNRYGQTPSLTRWQTPGCVALDAALSDDIHDAALASHSRIGVRLSPRIW